VRFEVQDRGPGIAAEQQALLFQPFQQLDSSDRRQKGGTGLGLAICKALVLRHQGEVGVVSQAGAGSTFWFEVPADGPARPEEGAA
jgi:signal transduction histidine kinase